MTFRNWINEIFLFQKIWLFFSPQNLSSDVKKLSQNLAPMKWCQNFWDLCAVISLWWCLNKRDQEVESCHRPPGSSPTYHTANNTSQHNLCVFCYKSALTWTLGSIDVEEGETALTWTPSRLCCCSSVTLLWTEESENIKQVFSQHQCIYWKTWNIKDRWKRIKLSEWLLPVNVSWFKKDFMIITIHNINLMSFPMMVDRLTAAEWLSLSNRNFRLDLGEFLFFSSRIFKKEFNLSLSEGAGGGDRKLTCGAAADDELALGFFCHSDLRRTETQGWQAQPETAVLLETPEWRSPGGCHHQGCWNCRCWKSIWKFCRSPSSCGSCSEK